MQRYSSHVQILQRVLESASQPRAQEFQHSLLLRPQTGESDSGLLGRQNLRLLRLVHAMAHQALAQGAYRLDVESAGCRRQQTAHRLAAMAQAEVDVGIGGQCGLSVFVVQKFRCLADAVFLAEAAAQFHIGEYRLAAALEMPEAHGLAAPPLGQLLHEALYVGLRVTVYMIVNV